MGDDLVGRDAPSTARVPSVLDTDLPRPVVRARSPLDPDAFAARAHVEPGCWEHHLARELFATHREEAVAHAARQRTLCMLWDDTSDEGELNAILVADARRVTLARARSLLRDAYGGS